MSATDNLAFESELSPSNVNANQKQNEHQSREEPTVKFARNSGLSENEEIDITNGFSYTSSHKKQRKMNLTWKNVNVSVPARKNLCGRKVSDRKIILQDVTGYAEPGTLLAIMGSSGAGKSTLLNVLTSRNLRSFEADGEILVNGIALGTDIAKVSAYVQQDDLFVGMLTVKEHLTFTANLRLDSSYTPGMKSARVQEVIKQMGLTDCENVRIGFPGMSTTISGGERKRLSFASEILTRPSILFCDEPTSGLDSYLSSIVVECMRTVAQEGCNVLCTIHQPSSETFELFDRLLLLAFGKVVYHGNREKAMEFYESAGYPCPVNYNPADHYIQQLSIVAKKDAEESRHRIDTIRNHYEHSEDAREAAKFIDTITEDKQMKTAVTRELDEMKKKPRYNVGFFQQFSACYIRALKALYRNPIAAMVKVIQTMILSLIFGFVFQRSPFGKSYDNADAMSIRGALFLVIIGNSVVSVNGVLNAFSPEIPIFRREHFNGMYTVSAYFLSKSFSEIPNSFLIPLLHSVIVYFLFGLYPSAAKFFYFYLYVALLMNVSVSYGYFISAITPNTAVALSIGPAMIMPLLILGGFFINPERIPVWLSWIKYVSWFYYTNELLNINQWEDVTDFGCSTTNTSSPTFSRNCIYKDGPDLLASFGFDAANLYRDIGVMIALYFSSQIFGLLALHFRVRESTR